MTVSKELFEAVTGFITDYNYVECGDISDGIFFNELNKEMSYNDFFFKCKEWAYGQGYSLQSCIDMRNPTKSKIYRCDVIPFSLPEDWVQRRDLVEQLEADSEQQAVFDACQWILENK